MPAPADDYLNTSTPIPLVLVDTWRIARLEFVFPPAGQGDRLARIWVAPGKRQDDGSVIWYRETEYVVSGPALDLALGQPASGPTIYGAARSAVYGLCQALGYIPAEAQETAS
ncbi:MAG: hypothetical protein OHK0022_28020 [Roseiflexaceae bacterium]